MRTPSGIEITTRQLIRQFLIAIPTLTLVVFALVVTAIQFPVVQTRIINTVSNYVTSRTDYTIDIGYTNLTWYDKFLFENIAIKDNQDSLLISALDFKVNISLVDLILTQKLTLEEVDLNEPVINLMKKTDSTAVNFTEFLSQLKGEKKTKTKEAKSYFELGSIKIFSGKAAFNDYSYAHDTTRHPTKINYSHIYTQIDDLQQMADTIDLEIVYFQAIDIRHQMDIRSMNGQFQYCNQAMTLSDLDFRTHKSIFKDSIRLNYASPSALSHFMDSVSFYVNLDSSHISTEDISLFAPSLSELDQVYELTGELKGTIGHLQAHNIDLRFGKNTYIDGDLTFFGLPKVNETFIDINCSKAILEPADIIPYIPREHHQRIRNVGTAYFTGQFLGFPTDFVANGAMDMQVGSIKSDINFKLGKYNTAEYSGNLSLADFNLGKIIDQEDVFQKVYLKGHILGHGLEIDNINFHLNADIDSIGIKGYNYSNIHTNGDLANGYFEGELITNDPNLVFDGQAIIDVRENADKITIDASLGSINLQPLGFSKKDVSLSSDININMKGFHIDSLKGFANLKHSRLTIDKEELLLDSVKFLSFLVEDERIVSLETDGLSLEAKGDFKNSTVINEITRLYKELQLNIENNQDSIDSYYSNLQSERENFNVDLKMNLYDANRFIEPFEPRLRVSKDIFMEGNFAIDNTSIISLNTDIDTIQFEEKQFISNQLDVNISKKGKSKEVLSSLFISSGKQIWNENSNTENVYLESIWSNNHVDLEFNLDQEYLKNGLDVKGTIDFLPDSMVFKLLKSDIEILGKLWNFSPENRITLTENRWFFNEVGIHQTNQSINVNGVWSELPSDQLLVDVRNFNVSSLNSVLPIEIIGVVDGNIDVNKLQDDVLIESNMKIQSFYIEDFLVGDIDCFSDWENHKERLSLEFAVDRENKKIIDVNGFYYPKKVAEQLEMMAYFDSANLNIIQPFVSDYFTDLDGNISGNFSITGNPSAPILQTQGGGGKISNGNITVNYTNASYKFSGGLVFEENHIGVQNLELIDNQDNKALFNGGINHNQFKDFSLNISGVYDNFRLLNTSAGDNSLYYGIANATGNLEIIGPVNNLQINADAKTEKGTRISIPVGETSAYSTEQKEYITFVDVSNSEYQKKLEDIAKEEIDLKGLKLDFDIEVTNDAYMELIFDIKSGDIIRGRGNGNIELQIDPFGDFNMFGDLQIESGGYNFTLYNIINKEFQVKRGSSISWYGDPYGAKLNINAQYRQLAALGPILTVTDLDVNSPEYRTKYPSFVNLNLQGNLLSPEISFDIEVEDYPDILGTIPLDAQIRAFKNRLLANEQEMKRQVFSLVILRKFSPENSFAVNSSQALGSSLSEFISNQLSYWATQVDENLEIDVNLAGLNEEAFNTFQLRLSYSFLDGRLKVTRGGGFSDNNNNSDVSTIIGDWTVEYLLTQDGRFRAKMYSRSNINSAASRELGENNIETGFSLQFVRSFDQLKHILSESRKSNKNKDSETPPDGSEKAQGIKEEEVELNSK